MALTGSEQRTDVIYLCPDDSAFVSNGGGGRIWYDDLEAAFEGHGNLDVIELTQEPED